MSESLTPISQLGEFGLIAKLTEAFHTKHKDTRIGNGDDAAQVGDWLIATDMMLEGVHFDLRYFPLKHLGYKVVAVNVSDICAMNGIPTHFLLSVAASSRFTVEALSEIYEGVKLACEQLNLELIGGDTSSSASGLVLSGTVLGKMAKGSAVKRSGAMVGDLVAVTGNLGAAYMGLQILEREKKIFMENPEMKPNFSGYEYIVGRQLKPEPRTDIVKTLEEMNIVPSSMIDISDGLASELIHLAKNSEVGFRIVKEKLPLHPQTIKLADEFSLSPTTVALSGGEDYELLFTVAPEDAEKLESHDEISIIGEVLAEPEGVFLEDVIGQRFKLRAQGWNHFQREED